MCFFFLKLRCFFSLHLNVILSSRIGATTSSSTFQFLLPQTNCTLPLSDCVMLLCNAGDRELPFSSFHSSPLLLWRRLPPPSRDFDLQHQTYTKPQVSGKINSSMDMWAILSSCPVEPPKNLVIQKIRSGHVKSEYRSPRTKIECEIWFLNGQSYFYIPHLAWAHRTTLSLGRDTAMNPGSSWQDLKT